ncbi:MAG: GNAT family N-acetyltransferase [Dehalococcoidia bacterium]
MTIEIRPCRDDEISAILTLWREAEAAVSVTDNRVGIEICLQHDPASLLVALDDGRIVGTVLAAWDGWRGTIYRLAVAPAYRRRGLASALIRHGERRLTALGAQRIQALVDSANLASLGAFGGQGWGVHQGMLRVTKSVD